MPGDRRALADGRDARAQQLGDHQAHGRLPLLRGQRAHGGDVVTSGCPYGNPKGYKQLMAYLESLKTWARK